MELRLSKFSTGPSLIVITNYFHSDIFVIKCQLVYFQSGSRFGINYEVQIYSDVGSKQYRIMVINNKS